MLRISKLLKTSNKLIISNSYKHYFDNLEYFENVDNVEILLLLKFAKENRKNLQGQYDIGPVGAIQDYICMTFLIMTCMGYIL